MKRRNYLDAEHNLCCLLNPNRDLITVYQLSLLRFILSLGLKSSQVYRLSLKRERVPENFEVNNPNIGEVYC